MESWHLPNLSVQIAPDCISEYLVSRDFVAPNGRSRAHIANILNYTTPGLTNKKRLGTPLDSVLENYYTVVSCCCLVCFYSILFKFACNV